MPVTSALRSTTASNTPPNTTIRVPSALGWIGGVIVAPAGTAIAPIRSAASSPDPKRDTAPSTDTTTTSSPTSAPPAGSPSVTRANCERS